MIIPNVRKVRTADPQAFAWAGLRKFQNVELITEELVQLHNVPAKFRDDVKKQARQIRYCVIQAREYFAAAQAVSLATKPNLLYYGTMSLALAEILYKQSGDSSLDKARSEHRHHGLSMTAGGIPGGASLAISADALRALPLEIDGQRKGTFELWHRSSRESPIGGNLVTHFDSGHSTGFQNIYVAIDEAYPKVPANGVTLKECFSCLPFMVEHVSNAGISTNFVRGTALANHWPGENWRRVTTVTIHPSPLVADLIEGIKVEPSLVSFIDLTEIATGIQIQLTSDWINGSAGMPLPPASMINTGEWRMWTNKPPLNEFGYFYVALFIAGNYARYFPDRWLYDAERSTPLALAIEELCSYADWRVPWLSLCELGRTLLVNEA